MPAYDRVRLDRLDGFEFEKFCALVFDRLGYGLIENLPSVGDKGRDLIIHGPKKIVVECKHQPSASIGRPIVQKLHSAVISERADAGWLVTSGGFSRQAIEHAAEIGRSGIELKLIDRAMLLDMAHRAGIEVLGKSEKPVSVVESPPNDQLIHDVKRIVSERLLREPHDHGAIDRLTLRGVTVVPLVCAIYDVHQEWHVGTRFGKRLLHSVHLSDQSLILNAHTNRPVDQSRR